MKRVALGLAAVSVLGLGMGEQTRAEILYATSADIANPEIFSVDTSTNTAAPAFQPQGAPDSLVFDTHGNIIYSALYAGQVRVFNPTTKADTLLASGFNSPLDLQLDLSGASVLISDSADGIIDRINLTTHAVSQLGSYGGRTDGLTYDNTGRLFANLGNRIPGQSIIAQLDPVTGAILKEHTGLTGLDGLTYDPFSGKLYAADGLDNLVLAIDPNTLATSVLPNSSGVQQPDGIEADGMGNLFIASQGDQRVYRYELNSDTLSQGAFVPNLDDIAPLSGAGAPPFTAPEPTSLVLFGAAALTALGFYGLRRLRLALTQAAA